MTDQQYDKELAAIQLDVWRTPSVFSALHRTPFVYS
jgi:hypothetical protein